MVEIKVNTSYINLQVWGFLFFPYVVLGLALVHIFDS